ncbi:MAG: cell division protein FtsZ, partial [Rubrivivax sp.]|nr:cell division protein FtsZ [Rubrivivax sp.]
MSLTWALLALAALVLVVIAVQGYWPLRRGGGERTRTVQAQRSEPPLGEVDAQDAVPSDMPRPIMRAQPRLDALIDALVPLLLEQQVTGEFVILHLPASHRAGSKPFYIEGLSADNGQWEPPQPGQRYAELQAGVQLVNRGGALNEIEYSEFVQKVQAFADAVGATPEVPDMLDVVARARELDAFVSPRDAQLSVTLR